MVLVEKRNPSVVLRNDSEKHGEALLTKGGGGMRDIITGILFFVVAIIILGLFAWFACVQEANTFNKFSNGPKATAKDAFFIELRVDARGYSS